MMRTWQHWEQHRQDGSPLDLADYEAIGTMSRARCSLHADEAYREVKTDRGPQGRREALQATDGTRTRQPGNPPSGAARRTLRRRCRTAGRSDRGDRQVPPSVAIVPDAAVRIIARERLDRRHFARKPDPQMAAARPRGSTRRANLASCTCASPMRRAGIRPGKAGLWRNPDLRLALDWFGRDQPNAAWAERYGGAFELRRPRFLRRQQVEGAGRPRCASSPLGSPLWA